MRVEGAPSAPLGPPRNTPLGGSPATASPPPSSREPVWKAASPPGLRCAIFVPASPSRVTGLSSSAGRAPIQCRARAASAVGAGARARPRTLPIPHSTTPKPRPRGRVPARDRGARAALRLDVDRLRRAAESPGGCTFGQFRCPDEGGCLWRSPESGTPPSNEGMAGAMREHPPARHQECGSQCGSIFSQVLRLHRLLGRSGQPAGVDPRPGAWNSPARSTPTARLLAAERGTRGSGLVLARRATSDEEAPERGPLLSARHLRRRTPSRATP
jgi:hypothetical protein